MKMSMLDLTGDAALYDRLSDRAAVVAKRLVLERGLVTLDDLTPEVSCAVLKAAWREAASDLLPAAPSGPLGAEIDDWVDGLILDVPVSGEGMSACTERPCPDGRADD
jgi:hypothetical protein